MSDGPSGEYWDDVTKTRWFFLFLAFSTGAMVVLFSPYLYVLLFAAVLVVVSWPVYQKILEWCRGRRALAAVLTMIALAVTVFGPLVLVVYLFVVQALQFIAQAIAFLTGPDFEIWLDDLQQVQVPQIEQQIAVLTGQEFQLVDAITQPIQSAALAVLEAAGTFLPNLLSTTVNAGIDSLIFLFAVVSLYMEGPRVLQVAMNLSPMDDAYEEQLFTVFRKFANNMVLGSLATMVLQGIIATIGYAIVGVPQVVFLGILTGLGAFIPVVGTAVFWVPVTIYVAVTQGIGWAVFIAAWSMVFTGSVDNIIKPLILRGGTKIHPLLVFLGVFGGLSWMGVPGVLVGPVIVAFFLALYTIYVEDFLGLKPEETPGARPPGGLMARIRKSLHGMGPARDEEAEPDAT